MTHTPERSNPAAGIPLTHLLDQYTARAWSLARRIVGDDRLAEDVVQEAFVAYWRHPAAYDATRGSFASWFLALVHHKAVDVVRRETAHRRRADAAGVQDAGVAVPDVAEIVIDRVADLRVRTALASLSDVQREALVLAYWGGYTQQEIALRVGAPLGTVKTRMHAGMRRLRDRLGPVVPVSVPAAGPSLAVAG